MSLRDDKLEGVKFVGKLIFDDGERIVEGVMSGTEINGVGQ